MSRLPAVALFGLLAACAQKAPQQCPELADVTPASIGTGYVASLTPRLAGGDRENTITEAIGEMQRRDPQVRADAITDMLIAADCPNAATRPNGSLSADRDRIAAFRSQVDTILGPSAR